MNICRVKTATFGFQASSKGGAQLKFLTGNEKG